MIIETLNEAGIPVSPDPSTPNIQLPFQYCTRCGCRVSPYHPREWASGRKGEDDVTSATQGGPRKWPTEYWCERCQTVWQALALTHTFSGTLVSHFVTDSESLAKAAQDLAELAKKVAEAGF